MQLSIQLRKYRDVSLILGKAGLLYQTRVRRRSKFSSVYEELMFSLKYKIFLQVLLPGRYFSGLEWGLTVSNGHSELRRDELFWAESSEPLEISTELGCGGRG